MFIRLRWGYIDFNNPNYEKSRSVKDFCRWVDNRFIFKTTKWEDYNRSSKKDMIEDNNLFMLLEEK